MRFSLKVALLASSVVLAAAPASTGQASEASNSSAALHSHGAKLEGGAKYSFMAKDSSGRPARWNPCKPIRWAYNAKRQNKGGLQDTKRTVRILAKTSGLKFKYVGKTKSSPHKGTRPAGVDLRVGWGTPRTHPSIFPKNSNLLGYAAMNYQWQTYSNGTNGTPEITSADLVMNSSPKMNRKLQRLVLLHELGHAVGLGHTSAKTQLMYPTAQPKFALRYKAGDRAGLRRLGSKPGCISNPIR